MTGNPDSSPALRWHQIATSVLSGHRLKQEEARAVLQSSDEEILDLLAATYRVRHHFFW